MKNTSLILNLVLLVAVVVIYILHFTSDKPANVKAATPSTSSVQQSDLKFAYLKVDSLIAFYDLAIDLNEKFSQDQESYSSEFNEKYTTFQQAATTFQEKLQSGGFATEERAIQERDRLLGEEEKISNLEEELTAKLNELQNANSQQLEDSIMTYLRSYNETKQYSYILDASGIIIGDDANNITKEILDALNTRYSASK